MRMRKAEKEITDREEVESVLKGGKIMHLAMCDGDRPYVVPLTYGYDRGRIFFHCALEGRKLDVLRRNNQVCFAIDLDHQLVKGTEACKADIRYRSVIGEGTAHLVTDAEEKKKGLDVLMNQVFGDSAYSYGEAALQKMVIVRIDVLSAVGKKSGY